MDEDEAALLAELKAISNRSATSRFDDYDDDDLTKEPEKNTVTTNDATKKSSTPSRKDPSGSIVKHPSRQASPAGGRTRTPSPATTRTNKTTTPVRRAPSPATARRSPAGSRTPPIKAGAKKPQTPPTSAGRNRKPPAAVVDRVETERRKSDLKQRSPSPAPQGGQGIKSNLPSTFQGDRGGPAEDAELLAELRKISSQSGAADRFRSEEEDAVPPSSALEEATSANEEQGYGIKSNLPSTFSGDRGGAAEDAELLAELRAISAKSGASDRFASDEGAEEPIHATTTVVQDAPEPPPPSRTSSKRETRGTPPWKRKSASNRNNKGQQDDVVVVASPAKNSATGGIKSSLPNTFTGDRGGAAEDEELLAELRAISDKSASAGRFQSDEDENQGAEIPAAAPERSPPRPKSKRDPNETPPWKRKNGSTKRSSTPQKSTSAASPGRSPARPPQSPGTNKRTTHGGIKSSLPNTFTGERGGAAEDAELLAELKAISNKSDRFVSEDDNNDDEPGYIAARASPGASRSSSGFNKSNKEESVSRESGPIQSSLPKTFNGDRGGAAEDAELLAELQAISSSSGAAGRFGDDEDDKPPVESREQTSRAGPASRSRRDSTPPWKRRNSNKQSGTSRASTESSKAPDVMPSNESAGYGLKSSLPNTFNGDRGGAAEDEELLAELRAISAGSSASRFASEDDQPETVVEKQPESPMQRQSPVAAKKPAGRNKRDSTPPWKRKSSTKSNAQPASQPVATEDKESADVMPANESAGFGLKSSLPNTFSGDRGGAAEDAELLAELRAISAGSSASRFASGDDQPDEPADKPSTAPMPRQSPVAVKKSVGRNKRDSTPPWKRKSSSESNAQTAPEPAQSTNESAGYGLKSSLPNTFNGDRGGAAEDAELLAELRAISAGSASNRFDAGDDHEEAVVDKRPEVPMQRQSPVATKAPPSPSPFPSSGSAPDSEEEVTEETLPSALVSKDWKLRVQSYELLNRKLKSLSSDEDSIGKVDSDEVMENLDGMVAKMAEDTNVGALDKALEFLLTYAEYCRKAGEAEQAAMISMSLVKKNGLSSRPSTLKLASDLALKLMEVGVEGTSSAHAVIEILLTEGLKSKKPKVVLASGSLVHSACVEFGVSVLPLHAVESAIPQILSNPNVKVREIGLMIMAELCRALSKGSFQKIIDQMKSAQVSELDGLLAKQPDASPPLRRLRSASGNDSGDGSGESGDPSSLRPSTAELEAQRYAARPAVNLIAALPKTEYPTRIDNQKWSEKVAALKAAIEAGGEKPYKLVQPSPTVNYIPLISEMKQLLKHTHFAVVSKAMEVIAMLAEGVGERLFPQLRPVLPTLLKLTKDKKLTKAAGSAVDALFGNVLSFDHILDQEDAIIAAVDEKKEKNAIARTSSLEYLVRCVNRNGSAGPRSSLSSQHVNSILKLATLKLDDSDAGVRKEAMNIFHALKSLESSDFEEIVVSKIESLQSTHARAYKTITGSASMSSGTPTKSSPTKAPIGSGRGTVSPESTAGGSMSPRRTSAATRREQATVTTSRTRHPPKKPTATDSSSRATTNVSNGNESARNLSSMELEEAVDHLAQLGIPEWDSEEDDRGVLAGLSSSKWTLKNDAIKTLSGFIETGQVDTSSKDTSKNSSSILVVTKEHTRGFKETNVNIMKSILQLFSEVCAYHESANVPLMEWAVADGATAAVLKIQDKKLYGSCSEVLSWLCVVAHPNEVLLKAVAALESVKSPIGHENMLRWFVSFCHDFGAQSIGPSISEIVSWLLREVGSSNPKVKKEASVAIGELHKQLGPAFKALALQMSVGSHQALLEQAFESNPYDPQEGSKDRPKQSICRSCASAGDEAGANGTMKMDIPRTDLSSSLDVDIVSKMNSKDGKAAWKMRKEAIEEVSTSLKSCNGLLDASGANLRFMVELCRALRDRLTDTQINLRPLAARTIGDLVSKVDKPTQSRLGKIVFPALVNSSMHDIKKPVRDAAIDAITSGVRSSSLEGSEPNEDSLEALFVAFTSEFNDTALRSTGLADLLSCLHSFVEYLPNFMEISSSQGSTLGDRYAKVLIDCLSSSKAEVRSAAFSLIEKSIEHDVIATSICHQTVDVMKPAKQRSVAPLIAKLAKPSSMKTGEKENVPSPDTRASKASHVAGESSPAAKIPGGRASINDNRSGSISRQEPGSVGNSSRRGSIGRQEPKHSNRQQMSRSRNQLPPSHQPSKESSGHPLLPRTGGRAIQPKYVAWPQFPEEPNGPLFMNLKRSWSTALPPSSSAKLFPPGGIKKQDDAKEGCELLERALTMELDSGSHEVVDIHLECMLKWIAFVLCCKEATVGLQSILSLIDKLFGFLLELKRGLSEDEVCVIVPFLIEKTSNAKGRFRESFMEIVGQLRSETLISTKILGPVACVQVIERSNHAKARALAFAICRECVVTAGLPGIGKKGVVVAAKSLSEEHLPETKAAALDLMEEIVRRMNGDVTKLAKICGTALSSKAQEAIEERWKKNGSRKELLPPPIPSVKKMNDVPVELTPERRNFGVASHETPGSERSATLQDELPAFNLRSESEPLEQIGRHEERSTLNPNDPFAFGQSAMSRADERLADSQQDSVSSDLFRAQVLHDPVETARAQSNSINDMADSQPIVSHHTSQMGGTLGTAASLRARLLKIKEKNKGSDADQKPPQGERDFDDISAILAQGDGREEYKRVLSHVKALLVRSTPLLDDDPDILTTTRSLKKVHTALANSAETNGGGQTTLKKVLVENVSVLISHLIR